MYILENPLYGGVEMSQEIRIHIMNVGSLGERSKVLLMTM